MCAQGLWAAGCILEKQVTGTEESGPRPHDRSGIHQHTVTHRLLQALDLTGTHCIRPVMCHLCLDSHLCLCVQDQGQTKLLCQQGKRDWLEWEETE